MIWEKQSGGLFRGNLIIDLKRLIYKTFESFATPNGNILATIKYLHKTKSYQTSSPTALLLFFAFFFRQVFKKLLSCEYN